MHIKQRTVSEWPPGVMNFRQKRTKNATYITLRQNDLIFKKTLSSSS